ncbi:MAG: PilZ domain-containing protein [Thermodesulfobacteriota bacterium]
MNRRRIPARVIIEDIRNGMTGAELMEKYEISREGLQLLLRKLVEARALRKADLVPGTAESTVTTDVSKARSAPRNYMFFTIPVFDVDDLYTEGIVNDITEQGLQVEGIVAEVGDARTFLIRADEFAEVFPFAFEAVCRWVRYDSDSDTPLAGFEIVNISDGGRTQIRKLVQLLTLGE